MPYISAFSYPPLAAAAARRTAAISAASPLSSSQKLSFFLAAIAECSAARPSPSPSPSPAARLHPVSRLTALARAGRPDDALRLFRHLKLSRSAPPSAACYNSLLDCLLLARRPADARHLLDEMLASGVAPTTATYTIILKSHLLDSDRIDSAYETIASMVRAGCRPDSITYSTLIAGLCRAGRLEEAWGVLDQMLEENLAPTVQAYTCIVRGYCLAGRIDEAARLVDTLESVGCMPDNVTYTVLIEGLCERKRFDEVERVLRESSVKGWKPNEVTYNIYMSGLCRAGRVDDVFRQLDAMRESGLHPTIMTLNILFDCLCRDSKVWEAKRLLEASGELGWEVDEYFYNTLMSRFYEIGGWVTVLKLLTDMVKKGISPTTCTFTIVIRTLCKAGKLQNAKCIISSRGFDADVVVFNTLMHWCYMAGMGDEVKFLFSVMDTEGVTPNKFTYCIIIDTLCSEGNCLEAIGYFLRSLKSGFLPELVVRLIYWLVKRGNLGELLNLFEEIITRGLVLDGRIFSSLIKATCRKGLCRSISIYKVNLILDRMLGIR